MQRGMHDAHATPLAEEVAKADPPPEPRDRFDEHNRRTDLERKEADLKLSKVVGYGALLLMSAQVVAADTAFFLYGVLNGWRIPSAAIDAWLAAAVIQVIGVVLVITRYLFPTATGSSHNA